MAEGVLDAIGNTPLVRMRGLPGGGGELYAKLELLNPFGMKDRVAKHILLEARRRGMLSEGAPIVESSSGTMALGVALVGGALGHPVHIVTDPRIDAITSAKLHALGCRVTVVEHMTSRGWQSCSAGAAAGDPGRAPEGVLASAVRQPRESGRLR
jgi:cysteine synthase A